MQILPFIFSFLLFFSISLTYLFDGLKDSSCLKTSLSGYFDAFLTLENAQQEHLYKSTEKAKKDEDKEKEEKKDSKNQAIAKLKKNETNSAAKSPSKNKARDKTAKRSPRKNKKCKRIYTCSQLNIYPLLKEGKQKQPELFLLFKRFLNHFYKPFFDQKGLDEHLIDSLIEQMQPLLLKDAYTEISLASLVFKDQTLQKLFYQILKGSGNYRGEEGYPALFDYVKVTKREKAKICLAKCPDELLIALMGEKRAFKLLELRKNAKEFKLAAIQTIYQTELDSVSYNQNYVVSHSNHKKSCLLLASDDKQRVLLKKQL